jgi:mRNA-degrading endonuclease RelE of RelBE toxin-antitoxin system
MNGKPYNIFMAPSAHRIYKKFSRVLQEKIKSEALEIAKEPYVWKELKSPFKGIRARRFTHGGTEYRIAYRIVIEQQQMEIVLVGPRENFYKILSKNIK